MLDICKVTMVGRLTSDPKSIGDSGCRFDVASNRRKDSVTYLSVVCWDNLAAQVLEYCKKGTQVAVVGDIEVRKFNKADGTPGKDIRIAANEVNFGYNAFSDDGVSKETKKKAAAFAEG